MSEIYCVISRSMGMGGKQYLGAYDNPHRPYVVHGWSHIEDLRERLP